MEALRYMISDAAKKIDVEPHVLRYWEEELAVDIPRNEMGHRYYREEDVEMMGGVKFLKEKGFQLKSIRILLPELDKVLKLTPRRLLELRDRLELAVNQEELRLQREQELEGDTVQSVSDGDENVKLSEGTSIQESGNVSVLLQNDKMQQFRNIMNEIILGAMRENNRVLTGSITESVSREFEYQMKKREMMEEEHFKQLDRTLREYQQGQKQAAVAKEYSGRRESKFFKKNRKVKI